MAIVKRILAALAAVPLLALTLTVPAQAGPAAAPAAADPNAFDPCFGHAGVHIPGKRAYECAYERTYWSVNLNTIQWDFHPPAGGLWVHADTLLASPLTSPPNPWRYFTVTIAGPFGGCQVVDAGAGEEPADCTEMGGTGPTQGMTREQAASYEGFERQLEDMGAPWFAWRDAPGT